MSSQPIRALTSLTHPPSYNCSSMVQQSRCEVKRLEASPVRHLDWNLKYHVFIVVRTSSNLTTATFVSNEDGFGLVSARTARSRQPARPVPSEQASSAVCIPPACDWCQSHYFFFRLILDVLCTRSRPEGFSGLAMMLKCNFTARQWLKRGHESQERGQDGVSLFTMHKHKVRSDFCFLSLSTNCKIAGMLDRLGAWNEYQA